jgi:hypothetical protein
LIAYIILGASLMLNIILFLVVLYLCRKQEETTNMCEELMDAIDEVPIDPGQLPPQDDAVEPPHTLVASVGRRKTIHRS